MARWSHFFNGAFTTTSPNSAPPNQPLPTYTPSTRLACLQPYLARSLRTDSQASRAHSSCGRFACRPLPQLFQNHLQKTPNCKLLAWQNSQGLDPSFFGLPISVQNAPAVTPYLWLSFLISLISILPTISPSRSIIQLYRSSSSSIFWRCATSSSSVICEKSAPKYCVTSGR